MPALPQFDYLFAIGTLFAFLDAWNIGKHSPPLILVTSIKT
jgi:PiT family inorganic phosphate transporter/sodium-dependent phosphate transporter